MEMKIMEKRQVLSRCGRRTRKRRKISCRTRQIVCSQDREIIELRQWMKKMAGFKCSLIPAIFHGTGRGLMTKKSISPRDVLISLPKSLLVTTETVLASQVGEHMKNWVPKLTLQEAISVFIIWERSRSSLSPWQPYLSSLPKRFTTPGYFSDTELSLLPVSVYSKCVMEVNKIKESYRKISEYCKSEWTAFHQLLTLDVFTWAWYVINTRSVYYKRPTCKFLSPDEEDHLALAPFLDLLNHSATANVSAGFNEVLSCYEIRTFDSYKKYDQVFISYGQHDNHKLFVEYGFCIPDNSNDVYEFSYDDLLDVCKEFNIKYIEKKLQILRENKLIQSLCCSADGVSWKLWTALKTLSLTWTQMQIWSDVCISGHDDAELVSMATNMSRSLINRALLKNQEGLRRIQEMDGLQMEGQNLNPDHVQLARILTEIDQGILKQSLSLLG